MRSAALLLCIFALAWDFSSATLVCYKCEGNDSDCPLHASDTDPGNWDTVTCGGALTAECAKYSVNFLNGETYTYRNCVPSTLEEYGDSGVPFCTFVKSLYAPMKSEGLIEDSTCTICNTVTCNT